MKIELSDEQVNQVVYKDLSGILSSFKADLKKVKQTSQGFVVSLSAEEDSRILETWIAAFQVVVNYYDNNKDLEYILQMKRMPLAAELVAHAALEKAKKVCEDQFQFADVKNFAAKKCAESIGAINVKELLKELK